MSFRVLSSWLLLCCVERQNCGHQILISVLEAGSEQNSERGRTDCFYCVGLVEIAGSEH